MQKRKGEGRADFQKPLDITVCLYCYEKKQKEGQQGSRSCGVEMGRNEVMKSLAGVNDKSWKEDVSGEVTLDLVELC